MPGRSQQKERAETSHCLVPNTEMSFCQLRNERQRPMDNSQAPLAEECRDDCRTSELVALESDELEITTPHGTSTELGIWKNQIRRC